MIEVLDGLRDNVVAAVVGVVLGSGGLLGLAGAYLRYRAKVELARELSERTRVRTAGLVKLLPHLPAGGKIVEQDSDGHRRVVHLNAGNPRPASGRREAA